MRRSVPIARVVGVLPANRKLCRIVGLTSVLADKPGITKAEAGPVRILRFNPLREDPPKNDDAPSAALAGLLALSTRR
jgi:hypothetical protein